MMLFVSILVTRSVCCAASIFLSSDDIDIDAAAVLAESDFCLHRGAAADVRAEYRGFVSCSSSPNGHTRASW